jgi:hypothetical protein
MKRNIVDVDKLKRNKGIWDLFTRKEEYNPLILDRHGKFRYFLSDNRDILKPRVSEFLMENRLNVEYPEDKQFAVCLTHDIDSVYPTKLDTMFSVAKFVAQYQIKRASKMLFSKINKRWNPYWNFKDIMALEEKYGAKSSFYFLMLNKDIGKINYDILCLKNKLGKSKNIF